jgi:ATP-dependent protease Clp ATPase subunit
MKETCSFCTMGQEPGRRLIAGAGVFICSDCVRLASEVFADMDIEPKVRCAICRETGEAQDYLEFPNRGYLCSACVRAARAATDSLVR